MPIIRGDRLPVRLRAEVLRIYVHRHLDTTSKTDDEWLRKHAFRVTKSGELSRSGRYALPAFMAEKGFSGLGKPPHVTKHFKRYRQFPPSRCAPGSFRTKRTRKGLLVVCCPKGRWSRKRHRCTVGTRVQSILKRR